MDDPGLTVPNATSDDGSERFTSLSDVDEKSTELLEVTATRTTDLPPPDQAADGALM